MMTLRETVKSQLPFLILAVISIGVAYYVIVHGMVQNWINDDNNSHGFIVPVVSAYLIWKRRDKLLSQATAPSLWGLGIVIAGTGLLILGWLANEFFTQRFSLLVVLCGCIVFWYGWRVMAVLAGPVAYLILMIPIPAILYDAVAFPLKLLVSYASVGIMKAMGVMVVREGNVMAFPNITLEVVNACSGLRSLTSLLAIGLAYIMLFVNKGWHKLALVVCIFPIALAANMIRVIGTGLLAQHYGAAAAEGFFHEFAGLVIFSASIAMLVAVHRILARVSR
jgi:exosortase